MREAVRAHERSRSVRADGEILIRAARNRGMRNVDGDGPETLFRGLRGCQAASANAMPQMKMDLPYAIARPSESDVDAARRGLSCRCGGYAFYPGTSKTKHVVVA